MPRSSLPRNLAFAYALLVAYACLHPFAGWHESGLPLFDYLIAPWPKYFQIEDLVFNVLGYIPLGFIVAATLPSNWPALRIIVVTTLGASLFSLGLETVQHYLPSRISSNIDLGANSVGGLIGAALGACCGQRMFAPHAGLARWRSEHFIGGHTGDAGLILLGLWLLTQLTPDSLLFGSGDVRRMLSIPPPLPFRPERFIAFEATLTACTIVAIGLFARCMMRTATPWPILALLTLGIGAKTLAAATFFMPTDPLAWVTPGAERGLVVGAALLAAALLLPRVVQHAVAGTMLLAATALVNLMPENPYLSNGHTILSRGNFLNFHGLTQLVASIWPFVALAYLSALGLWRGEHLDNPRRL
ncbi:MAG: VanZ family protein [Azoarcus sp.]|nr:VanZ family protein [Azoarcus sp.]